MRDQIHQISVKLMNNMASFFFLLVLKIDFIYIYVCVLQ